MTKEAAAWGVSPINDDMAQSCWRGSSGGINGGK